MKDVHNRHKKLGYEEHLAIPALDKSQPPEYEKPAMITYSEEELLEELGPIQACTGF